MGRIDHVTSLILTRRPLRDFDRRIVVYTRELGKLTLTAKGTQRIVSKLAGSLEPLTEAQVSFARGRTNRIIGSVRLQSWEGLREELRRLAAASFLFDAVDHLVQDEHADAELYDLIRDTITSIAGATPQSLGLLVRRALWRMIDRLGFRPRFDRCVTCGKELGESRSYSPSMGGALCDSCKDRASDGVQFTTAAALALDRLLTETEAESAGGAVDRLAAQIVESTLLAHLGERLPTDTFWRSMNRASALAV